VPVGGSRTSDKLEVSWLTNRGRERPNNEDSCLALPERGLIMVSDGMGGEAAGEVASRHVAEWLPGLLEERLDRIDAEDTHAIEAALEDAIRVLSHRVREEASTLGDGAKMGATLTMALAAPPRLHTAHIGDSRAYLLRRGRLSRLTHDHSVVGTLLERGIISAEQAIGHPMRGQLTRYVGMGGKVLPDVSHTEPKRGDLILLCTDGLTNEIPDERIRELLQGTDRLVAACRELVDEANRAGGRDNITVVLARWVA
jgi:protein phosphatase